MTNNVLRTVTDEVYREEQRHGNSDFPFGYYSEDVYAFALHCIDWHWHSEIEMVYAAKGNIVCYIGTDKLILRQGCGLFVNSGVLHRYEATESVCMPNIVFAPELLGDPSGKVFAKYIRPILGSGADHMTFEPDIQWQNTILKILCDVFSMHENGGASELQTVKLLLELWDILYSNRRSKSESPAQSKDIRHRSLLQLMMQFIHAHYHERITLADISSSVYISKNSALDIFRESIRLSPIAYLINYRLNRAAELLSSTDMTVAAVSDKVGFEDPAYFCRKFKQLYKLSPARYRKNAEKDR